MDCISKGKAHKRYEFGVKASIATTAREAYVVGARSYPGNPYDGHTLADQLQQVHTITDTQPELCFVEGYHCWAKARYNQERAADVVSV